MKPDFRRRRTWIWAALLVTALALGAGVYAVIDAARLDTTVEPRSWQLTEVRDNALAIAVAGCGLEEIKDVAVEQRSDRVAVTVQVRQLSSGECSSDSALVWCRLVTLDQPLADRPLFDGVGGEPKPRTPLTEEEEREFGRCSLATAD